MSTRTLSPPAVAGVKATHAPARRRDLTPYLLLLPSLVLYAVFMLVPLVQTVGVSFTKWDGFTSPTFVGMRNYTDIFTDPKFGDAVAHNAIWTVMTIVVAITVALLLAATLARLRHGRTFFRVTFFLPNVVSLSVVAVLWGQIYNPIVGPINVILKSVGLSGAAHRWLGEPQTVLPAINLANNWHTYGFYMVILLAGLQGIDNTLYEAAIVDGAGPWALFRFITLPGLRNVLNLVFILAFVNALKGFTLVWIMTQGGPVNRSDLLATYIYRAAFLLNQLGPAAAASVVLSIIVIGTTMLFNKLREEEVT